MSITFACDVSYFASASCRNSWGALGPGGQGNADFVRSVSSVFTEGDARQMQLSPSASAYSRTLRRA